MISPTRSTPKDKAGCWTDGGRNGRSFFFSSRRRHTRWPRDWSSDVCSSDLERGDLAGDRGLRESERFGGCGEGPGLGDLAQDPEAADVEHDQSVYQAGAKIICVYGWRSAA